MVKTENEKELIEIIRNSSDPEKVMIYLISIMIEWLNQNTPKVEGGKNEEKAPDEAGAGRNS